MLERKPSLTEQAKGYIKQRILDGEFEGERIPSETELASELGVSRTTIRDALSRLEIEGVIYRRQGSGTYVNEPGLQIKIRLEEIWSYEGVLEAHGFRPSVRILDVQREPAGLELAAALNIERGAPVITVQKLFLGDMEPIILTENQIPAERLVEPYQREAWRKPVYQFLNDYGRQRLAYYISEIIPMVASGHLAQVLAIEEEAPLISFAEVGYDEENEPILHARSYLRDDLLRLRLIRRKVS